MHSKIYLVRHAETESNKAGLFGDGPLDDVFSELGSRQLRVTYGYFASCGIQFDRVISGSQVRQIMNARAVVGTEYQDLLTEDKRTYIVEDARLNEISVGEWSGKSKNDLDAQTLADWRAGKILPLGGESKEQFESRVLACWREMIFPMAQELIKETWTPEVPTGNILVVTSGNPIRMILGEVLGIPPAMRAQMDVQNGSIAVLRVVKIGNGFKVFLEQMNYLNHLRQSWVEVNMLPGTY